MIGEFVVAFVLRDESFQSIGQCEFGSNEGGFVVVFHADFMKAVMEKNRGAVNASTVEVGVNFYSGIEGAQRVTHLEPATRRSMPPPSGGKSLADEAVGGRHERDMLDGGSWASQRSAIGAWTANVALAREFAAQSRNRMFVGGRSGGADGDGGGIDFVAVVADGFLSGGAQLRLGCGFRDVALAAHDFVAGLDANEARGFGGVPGDFGFVGAHGHGELTLHGGIL